MKIERDVCASEIGRLRMVLNHLKLLYAKAQEENGDWIMCKKHLEKLTIINPKLQKTVDVSLSFELQLSSRSFLDRLVTLCITHLRGLSVKLL